MSTELQIIPVIDLREGYVVMANGLSRDRYPLLTSVLTTSTSLAKVVADLLAFYPFPTLYIADLDAIMGRGNHHQSLEMLCQAYPGVTFWLDAGIQTLTDCQLYRGISNLHLVVGTETLKDMSLFQDPELRDKSVLSLDLKQQQWLGCSGVEEQVKDWPDRVIVMSLDHVGQQQGPATTLLATLKNQFGEKKWFMAGGVRDQYDLAKVAQVGAKGALIATALHRGHINQKTLANYMAIK